MDTGLEPEEILVTRHEDAAKRSRAGQEAMVGTKTDCN